VQFVAGDAIEETFEQLRRRWFGAVQGLHRDQPEQLYFVSFWGYDSTSVAELHEFGVVVACSSADAKPYFVHLVSDSRAQTFVPDWFGYRVIG
jgi:hypothetical protein